MRDSVRAAFVGFTKPLEGVCPWMYLDVKGLVTTAIGNLIDPIQYALPLPWNHLDGSPAARDEIASEWLRVKQDPVAASRGHLYTEGITNLRLDERGIELVVSRKLDQNDQHLRGRFPEWEDWPADAQLACLSMAWACGPAFRFPMLEARLRAQDFAMAAGECHINEAGNPGIVPRNRANVALFRNAAKVQAYHLDPAALIWPSVLDDEAQTLPDGLPNPANSPTIHVDPAQYFDLDKDPDDVA
jgi:GH24 family phage-related lysozyme (muramidase)